MIRLDKKAVDTVNESTNGKLYKDELRSYLETSWIDVDSSNLEKVKFNQAINSFYVKFHGNSIYKYSPVTTEMFTSFMNAPSKGKWLDQNLKKSSKVVFERLV